MADDDVRHCWKSHGLKVNHPSYTNLLHTDAFTTHKLHSCFLTSYILWTLLFQCRMIHLQDFLILHNRITIHSIIVLLLCYKELVCRPFFFFVFRLKPAPFHPSLQRWCLKSQQDWPQITVNHYSLSSTPHADATKFGFLKSSG